MIDFEKVDMLLLSAIQQLNNIENLLLLPNLNGLPSISAMVQAIDALRFDVAVEIERQGTITSE